MSVSVSTITLSVFAGKNGRRSPTRHGTKIDELGKQRRQTKQEFVLSINCSRQTLDGETIGLGATEKDSLFDLG